MYNNVHLFLLVKIMSCFYCKHYMGLHDLCENGHMIDTGSESINCNEYEYNGEVKE